MEMQSFEKQPQLHKNEIKVMEEGESSSLADGVLEQQSQIDTASSQERGIQRALKPRHVSMIALGGTIGTGLFVGIANPLRDAGPVGSLISYLFMGSLAFFVTQSLGEMATFIPVASSFTVFTRRFLSPALGAANGYMYCFSWCITFALELSIVGEIIQYWTLGVPNAAWIIIFWVPISLSNLVSVKFYGEFQFWIALIKVIAIVGFLIYCLCMVCGAGKTGPVGFRYWRNPGPWGDGIISKSKSEGRFLGWVSSLVNAAFTYQGTELVGVSAGESANPRKTVPKAIRKVFLRILLFYVGSLFFIGLLVPFNDPKLDSTANYSASSPFIIAIQNSGTRALPDIFNAVILTTIISAANSNVYVGSRVLYGLAKEGLAPKIIGRINRHGVPYICVGIVSLFGFLGYLSVSSGSAKAFDWLLNITAIAGFFAWLFISLCHIRFMQALKYQGISRDDLPFKAKLMPWGAYYAAFFILLIIIIQGFTAFAPKFNVSNFFAAYVSVFLFIAVWVIFQVIFKSRLIHKVEDVDIDSDRREIEAEVWEDDEPTNLWGKFWAAMA
ncbi:amino acid permease [Lachancea thermotolerans CBS 6340]|uniref:KLTH0F02398p n=1 Tax=Lachancea thermotolerans (strain ATCC 56472 / CBS 6340 / NRRL Y-8284) TaxID=559295 RepID=C5DK77_LACTC|nr:KLTH0F02398p [Lachancea thermotolerans CBS 6340]CAR23878.1 KLTH0F02398p [Lachancea thermotolerans CBS 6340]